MAIDPRPRRIRLGMVGGGEGSFIGSAHRVAWRFDDSFEFVAGCLSSDASRNRASAAALGLDPARTYDRFEEMAERESRAGSGIDAVVIVTPNHLHAPVASAFLERGIDVVCDKPVAVSLDEADALQALAARLGRLFVVTYTYAGYPAVRQARQMVADGAVGEVRFVHVEYAQEWLARPVEREGQKQAAWRTDPRQAGPAGALGDIGTHAFHLLTHVTGCAVEAVSAELRSFVPGRALDDHVQAMLRLGGGASGVLWASQVAAGEKNALRLRVYGSRGSLAFDQERPDELVHASLDGDTRVLRRGSFAAGSPGALATRLPAGHPEGYFEALARLYADFAELWQARQEGRPPAAAAAATPQIADGRAGMAFVDAVLRSHAAAQAWTRLR